MHKVSSLSMTVLVGVLLMSLGGATGQTAPASDDAKRFVGTWHTVASNETGIMIYDNLGNMAVQVMPTRERKKYAGAQPTPDEAKDAITGYLAYFGTYTVDPSAHTITHHRKGALNPGQVGEDAVRGYEFAPGDRLLLNPIGTTNRITWERTK